MNERTKNAAWLLLWLVAIIINGIGMLIVYG